MKKRIYYFTQRLLSGTSNRQLNLLSHEDYYLSLAKITFSSDSFSTPTSSMRMCCRSMSC
ncbi:MAG: hypothetical protein Q8904_11655 [Bacteroidota bacterium]|nr:hypothetical protein [Bacteroidota bacterium]